MIAIRGNRAKRQKLSSRNNNPNVCFSNLPRDILINIFSKLPSKTILNCIRVCKEWHEIILDPSFAEAHYDHMMSNPSSRVSLVSYNKMSPFEYNNEIFIIEGYKYKTKRMRSERYKLESSKLNVGGVINSNHDFIVVNSCRGFLLLRGNHYFDPEMHKNCFSLYVYNPLTNDLWSVPKVIMKHHDEDIFSYTCSLGFSPVTNQYKVVCFLFTEDTQELAIHTVGSSSNTGVWRRLEVKEGYREILEKIWGNGATVSLALNGVIHWLTRRNVLACFDVEKEELYVMPSPCVEDPSKYVTTISTLNGLLCLGITEPGNSRNGVEMWVMGEYGVKESWAKYAVLKEAISKGYKPMFNPIVLEVLDNGEMVLLSSYPLGCLVLYDPSKEYSKRLRVPGVDNNMRVQLYVPSFFFIGN